MTLKANKIGIYLGNSNGKAIDALNIEKGNPGIGGTQFCMLQLAHALNIYGNYNVTIIANREYKTEVGINYIKCENYGELISTCEKNHINLLIVHQFNDKKFRKDIIKSQIKIIAWCHNYIYNETANYLSRTSQIKACVFVGKQMYDRYIDHDIVLKSTFIYNMFYDNIPDFEREISGNFVVYMGSIVPAKGFRELCLIWPNIIKKVPDAKLIVLGSGKLYGEKTLGDLGIADQKYENEFKPFITNKSGHIVPSVVFKGIVGEEKFDIFKSAKVGVVNPTGRTETFGMGIVEMGQAKLPVVTIGRNGHFDTVLNGKTGLLGKNLKDIQNKIIELLTDNEKNQKLGESAKQNISKFDPFKLYKKWNDIISQVINDDIKFSFLKPTYPFNNNQKWIRIFLRFFRFKLHLKFIPSLLKIESHLTKLIH